MTRPKPPQKKGPTAWRDRPRDENGARKPFPRKADFIERLRATDRPTARDLRILRALKKTPPSAEPV